MAKLRKIVLLVERSRAFGRNLLLGISQYSHLHGPWEFCMEPEFYRSRFNSSWRSITGRDADGIIAHTFDPRTIKTILASGLPAMICGIPEREGNAYRIVTKDSAIADMAADYLLNQGLKHLAYCGFDDMIWSQDRGQQFLRRISEAGLAAHRYELPTRRRQRLAHPEHPVLANWLGSLPKPVGVFTCCDDLSRDLVDACKRADLKIPDDVAILGVDNDELICNLTTPPLSSIALGTQQAGYEAAAILDALMAGKRIQTSQETVLNRPLYVVKRQSTDILAVEDREVAAAVRYIHNHARENLTVSHIAQEVCLARRTLEQRFRQVRGHSVHDEVKRVRRDQLTHLLTDTNLPIKQIARLLKYPDTASLSRWFKQETGVSPSQFRQHHQPFAGNPSSL